MSAPAHKRIKRFVRYWAVRTALALVALLPLRFAAALGRLFGRLAFHLAQGERRKALTSLARAFPTRTEAERWDLARRCFEHLACCAFELGCIAQIEADMEQFVRWPPHERAKLEAAMARGKGVVFITGHVGNWELLARRVALAGYPTQSIAKETSDPRLTKLVERFRNQGKVRSIWRGQEGAARHMLRALKQGEILGLLIDQDTRVQSLFVPFFGELAATPRAAADLALRTEAALMVGFCQRDEDGRYTVTMKEVEVTPDSDAHTVTAQLSAEIEQAIRRAPEQWVWMHQRWKTRPD